MGQSEILSELHSATETLKTSSCDCLQGMVSPLIRDEPISLDDQVFSVTC